MCTAASYHSDGFYFGRTLDNDCFYGESVAFVPRNYIFNMKHIPDTGRHYAIIGTALSDAEYPLFYDAMNEKGLCMAGLNFVKSTVYGEYREGAVNVAPYEFIPYILGNCDSVSQAKKLLADVNITSEGFSPKLPAARLHWIIADKSGAVTVESVSGGLMIYDNPAGVLTNEPSFDKQLFNLNNFLSLSPKSPENRFGKGLSLEAYSRGMGAMGLPGDLSSMSRFVRAAFVSQNSLAAESEEESVSQFFHILGSVDQQKGCCITENGRYEYTVYTSCMSADKGIYYYTAYDSHRIKAVDMNRENAEGTAVVKYPFVMSEDIAFLN